MKTDRDEEAIYTIYFQLFNYEITVRLCPSLLHPWLQRVKKRGAQPNPNMRNWRPSLFNLHSERNIEHAFMLTSGKSQSRIKKKKQV